MMTSWTEKIVIALMTSTIPRPFCCWPCIIDSSSPVVFGRHSRDFTLPTADLVAVMETGVAPG